MSFDYFSRRLTGDRVAVLSGYTRRLLSPPLPGDGLLVVGFVEGVIGWSLSWLLASEPSLAPFGLLESIVGLWAVLTAAIVAVGVVYTAPTVRRNRIWLVWAGLNASAIGVNVAAVVGWFPGPLMGEPLLTDLLGFGYWRPWFFALGLGYLATALYNWSNPQIRRSERVVYALGGIACLAVLSPWPSISPLVGTKLFLIGGLIHVVPMGFDVAADIVLILRRTG
ncbi:MAG: hypothetical protein ABEH88_03530 [Halobacteriales archaeon]